MKDAVAQTVGPRSKAYYESIPPKIDTGLNRRSDSEDSIPYIGNKPFVLESTINRVESEPTKQRRKAKSILNNKKNIVMANSPDKAMT